MSFEIDTVFIYSTRINSFHYLYNDADFLHRLANSKEYERSFDRVRMSRTAILLYVLSLEALINRALDEFLTEPVRSFIMEREDRFSIEDKWAFLPRLAGVEHDSLPDFGRYPWSHFRELVSLRNDFVHPKHDRPAYYRAFSTTKLAPLDPNEIPAEFEVKERDLVYRQNRIPKDPYSILPEHVDQAKKVVDDMIEELNSLLGGRLKDDGWLERDSLDLVFPPGATLMDLPTDDGGSPPSSGAD